MLELLRSVGHGVIATAVIHSAVLAVSLLRGVAARVGDGTLSAGRDPGHRGARIGPAATSGVVSADGGGSR